MDYKTWGCTNLNVLVLFILPSVIWCLSIPVGEKRFAHPNLRALFWCKKMKDCHATVPPVCGFDELLPFLAVFENECVLYHANCKSAGNFFIVDMKICEMKKKYDKEHANEPFEWEHVVNGTISQRDITTVKSNKYMKMFKME